MQLLVIEVTNFKMHRPTAVFKLWVSVKVHREDEEKKLCCLSSSLENHKLLSSIFLSPFGKMKNELVFPSGPSQATTLGELNF
jgi:hypothetical protein